MAISERDNLSTVPFSPLKAEATSMPPFIPLESRLGSSKSVDCHVQSSGVHWRLNLSLRSTLGACPFHTHTQISHRCVNERLRSLSIQHDLLRSTKMYRYEGCHTNPISLSHSCSFQCSCSHRQRHFCDQRRQTGKNKVLVPVERNWLFWQQGTSQC